MVFELAVVQNLQKYKHFEKCGFYCITFGSDMCNEQHIVRMLNIVRKCLKVCVFFRVLIVHTALNWANVSTSEYF